jgi:hypothetical protein
MLAYGNAWKSHECKQYLRMESVKYSTWILGDYFVINYVSSKQNFTYGNGDETVFNTCPYHAAILEFHSEPLLTFCQISPTLMKTSTKLFYPQLTIPYGHQCLRTSLCSKPMQFIRAD